MLFMYIYDYFIDVYNYLSVFLLSFPVRNYQLKICGFFYCSHSLQIYCYQLKNEIYYVNVR